jgi:hypothetical protein
VILQRVEIDLVGPDDWSEDEMEVWTAQERMAKFLFRDHLRIVIQQLRAELPEGFEVEANFTS